MSNRQLINAVPSEKILNAVQSDSFKVYAKADDDSVELVIFEEIGKDWFGQGIGAKDVAGFLAANKGKPVNVRLNSPGGLVFDGIGIFNALIQHDAPVTTTNEGVAASAAGLISLAGSPSRMYANATFQCHRALCIAIGNYHDMADCADFLDKIDNQIAMTMAAKTGRKKDTMLKLMDGAGKSDGTWFSAEEALAEGLIDEIIPVKNAKAKAARNELGKPTNCTCKYPETKLRNGSGHDPACDCHKEWQAAGGFGGNDTEAAKAEAAQKTADALARETQSKLAKAAAGRRVRLMEIGAE